MANRSGVNINVNDAKNKVPKNIYVTALAWGVVWTLFMGLRLDSEHFGILFALLNIPVSVLAFLIGDAIRRFAAPDVFTTKSAVDTVYKKIFWRVGPQIIAMIIASSILLGLMYS